LGKIDTKKDSKTASAASPG